MFRASGADLARDRGAKQKERATVRVRARVREPNSNRLQPTVRAMASNLIERERRKVYGPKATGDVMCRVTRKLCGQET